MKIGEILNQLTEFKNENRISDQTVEMVFSTQKFFFAGIEKSNNQATILIKRKDYCPYSIADFESLLNEFNNETEIFLAKEENPSKKLLVTNCFLSQCFLELEAQQ